MSYTKTPIKQFVIEESQRRGVSAGTIYLHIRQGKYKHGRTPEPQTPRGGEKTKKQFLQDEAERLNTTARAIEMRVYRGLYPNLNHRKLNSRVVMVSFGHQNVPTTV